MLQVSEVLPFDLEIFILQLVLTESFWKCFIYFHFYYLENIKLIFFLMFQVTIESEVKIIYYSFYVCPYMEDMEINN